jgi:hypothetical protein
MSASAKNILFMAQKKAGKSELAKKFFEPKVNHAGRGIVVCRHTNNPFHGPGYFLVSEAEQLQPDWKGVAVMLYREKETYQRIVDIITDYGVKGFPIHHDDMNSWAKSIMEKPHERLFQLCRNWGIDNTFTTHSWAQTPKSVMDYIDIIALGPTNRGPEARSDVFDDPKIIQRHMDWKRKADKWSDLPDDIKWKHPWFFMDFDGNEVKKL